MPKPGELTNLPKGLLLPKKKEKQLKPPNAVIYVRVSDPTQAKEGYSLEHQEMECRKYCSEKGYTVLKVFEDRGKSGYKKGVRRPGLEDLLRFCKKNASQISWVVFFNIKRLARNDDYFVVQRELEALEIEFASPTFKFGKTAHEKLNERNTVSQGQFESDEKSEYQACPK